VVHELVGGDSEQPRAEPGAVDVEALEVAQGPLKGGGGNILGRFAGQVRRYAKA
jgi:hypothetical protein